MLDTGQLPLTGNALLWFRQGLAAAVAENYPQAIAEYERVLEVRPDFYEAWYEKGLALESCGRYHEAIASYDRALNLRPKNDSACQIWHERGNAFQYGLGDYTEAIACYDRVLQMNARHELTWQDRGNALLYGLNRSNDAIACYDHVLQINPDNDLAWRNRGNALVELQRHAEAIVSYDRALAINPADELSWHARNLASERSGLNYKQPTTNPVWYGEGYSQATLVEGEGVRPQLSKQKAPDAEIRGLPQPLLVIEDDWGSREIVLENPRYLIGRDPSNDICLHSRFASRHHAFLTRKPQDTGGYSYQITDGTVDGKPSTNGIVINGHKHRSWDLQTDDVVVFGPNARAIYRLANVR